MPAQKTSSPLQFRLSTLLVMNLIAGVVIAYLRPKSGDLLLAAAICIVAGGGLGYAVGRWKGLVVERTFWGLTAPAMMLVLVAEVDLYSRVEIYVWPLIAAIAVVIAIGNSSRYVRMIWAAVVPGAIMMGVMGAIGVCPEAVVPNGVVAGIGGALAVLLIDVIRRTERMSGDCLPWIGLCLVLLTIVATEALTKWVPGW